MTESSELTCNMHAVYAFRHTCVHSPLLLLYSLTGNGINEVVVERRVSCIKPPLKHNAKTTITWHKKTSLFIILYPLCSLWPHFPGLCSESLWQKESHWGVTWLVWTSEVMGTEWTAGILTQAAATCREYSGAGISTALQLTISKASTVWSEAERKEMYHFYTIICTVSRANIGL